MRQHYCLVGQKIRTCGEQILFPFRFVPTFLPQPIPLGLGPRASLSLCSAQLSLRTRLWPLPADPLSLSPLITLALFASTGIHKQFSCILHSSQSHNLSAERWRVICLNCISHFSLTLNFPNSPILACLLWELTLQSEPLYPQSCWSVCMSSAFQPCLRRPDNPAYSHTEAREKAGHTELHKLSHASRDMRIDKRPLLTDLETSKHIFLLSPPFTGCDCTGLAASLSSSASPPPPPPSRLPHPRLL
ncbi:unnamed protein product [Protopolystoma xenopodis]|uniref:Uncharacterized protein n=1 Tax=Protopolystoma xenopodis TaxID=117903 RepID=A0A448X573_9PLAT|nr:unnamed protein product [Protopolystoma xenopodis]